MSTPLCFDTWLIQEGSANESGCVKGYQAGEAKLHEETQTAKLIVKEINKTDAHVLGLISDLSCATFRLTNLGIRNVLHKRNFVK